MVLHPWALVHVDHSNSKFVAEKVSCLEGASEYRALDAILRRIHELNSLLIILNLLEGHNRAEKLLNLTAHAIVRIGDDCWLVETTFSMLI